MVDIIPVADGLKNYHINVNITKNFNLGTLTPIFYDAICSVNIQKEKLFFKFHSVSYFVIILSYMIISSSILAVACKLRKRQKNLKKLLKEQSLNKSKTVKQSSSNENMSKSLLSAQNKISRVPSNNTIARISMMHKAQNTKMLLSLSFSFIIMNFPYFFFLFLIFLNIKSLVAESKEDLLQRITWKSYLTIVEIFQLAYFSVTGLLLFVSGIIFRFHLRIWFRKVPFFHLKDKKPSELDDENVM
jgi:hypothetical protein